MADLPSMKWLGLGATAGSKSSVVREGERQKREADIEYSQSLPAPPPRQAAPPVRDWGVVPPVGLGTGAGQPVSAPIANTPSQAELAVLQDLGWQTPGLDSPARKKKTDDVFNYQDKRIQESLGFDYELTEQQIKGLEDLYRDVPGYTPPDQSTADSIRVMAEKNELAPVTWKQWDKMTPDQRKAATWNSELWKATQKDIKLAGKRSEQNWTPEKQQKYDERVTAIFGEDGGSDVRAINTLKFLEKIDFTAVGQDLDEYLSGARLITAEEMKDFKVGTSEPLAPDIKTSANQVVDGKFRVVTPRAGYPGSISLVGPSTPEITTEIQNYEQLRSSANLASLDASAVRALDTALRERMSAGDTMGWNVPSTLGLKKMTPDDFPMGYSNPGVRGVEPDSFLAKKEAWFKDMWFNLNDPDQKLEDVLKDIQTSMKVGEFGPELQQEVWDWIDKRTRWHAEYGQPNDTEFPLRDPNEVRKALGWEK